MIYQPTLLSTKAYEILSMSARSLLREKQVPTTFQQLNDIIGGFPQGAN